MNSKYLFFFIVFFLIAHPSFSQKNNLRYLEQQKRVKEISKDLKKISDKESNVYFEKLIELARAYITVGEFDKTLQLIEDIQEKSKDEKIQASALATLGNLYFDQKEYRKSQVILLNTETLLKKNKQEDELCYIYRFVGQNFEMLGDIDQAITYFNKGLEISTKLNIHNRSGYFYDFLGHIYFRKADFEKAAHNFNEALKEFYEINLYHRIALSAGNVGLSYWSMNNKHKAIDYYSIAVAYYEKEDNLQGIIWTNTLLSNLYMELKEYDLAFQYNHRNIDLYRKNEKSKPYWNASIKEIDAKIYLAQKNYETAEQFFQEALDEYTQYDIQKSIQEIYINLAYISLYKNNPQKALSIIERILTQTNYSPENAFNIRPYAIKGAALLALRQTENGKAFLNQALEINVNNKTHLMMPFIYEHLAKADSSLNNFQAALENYKNYYHYFNLEEEDTYQAGKSAYQFEFKKKEELIKIELENQRLQRNIAIGSLAIAFLFIFILIRLFRLRNKNIRTEKENLLLQKREVEQIKKTEEFKSRFLTNITHEFRTPLTLINGHLDVLLDQAENAKNTKQLQSIRKGSDHLLNLINQLMELAKMENHQYKLSYTKGHIVSTALSVTQSFHSICEQRKLQLIVNNRISEEFQEQEFIYSIEVVSSILSNLISNASKFTPENGFITVDFTNIGQEFFEIKVRDTGKGIPSEELEHIFNRFYQIDTPEQRTYEGTGIGLAMVKELVKLHQGTIAVTSKIGEGTEFIIRLKPGEASQLLSEEMDISVENQEQNSIAKASESENIKASDLPLILVAEDKKELREFIVYHLGDQYQFIQAKDGKEAIELANQFLPDLIISDIMMPEVTGLEVCKQIKETIATSHIPIILLTAKVAQENKIEGLEVGADDYIVKPFSLKELQLRVRNIFKLKDSYRKAFSDISSITESPTFNQLSKLDQEFIEKVEFVTKAHVADSAFGVPQLADEMFLSSSQLTRKIKNLIEKTPAEYIRIIRLENAKKLLSEGMSVSDAAWLSGFEDPKYFGKVFKKYHNKAPSQI